MPPERVSAADSSVKSSEPVARLAPFPVSYSPTSVLSGTTHPSRLPAGAFKTLFVDSPAGNNGFCPLFLKVTRLGRQRSVATTGQLVNPRTEVNMSFAGGTSARGRKPKHHISAQAEFCWRAALPKRKAVKQETYSQLFTVLRRSHWGPIPELKAACCWYIVCAKPRGSPSHAMSALRLDESLQHERLHEVQHASSLGRSHDHSHAKCRHSSPCRSNADQ